MKENGRFSRMMITKMMNYDDKFDQMLDLTSEAGSA